MSCIHACSLSILSNTELVFASTTLCLDTCSKITLSIFQYITKQLCKLTCVFCLFKSITLESLCNFWISFAICLTRHCKIHTYLTTFAIEVSLKILYHLWTSILIASSSKSVNSCKLRSLRRICYLFELATWSFTQRTYFRSFGSFINISANGTNEFLLHIIKIYVIVLLY